MKKVYVAVAAAMILAGNAAAQMKVGVEAGINLNNLADQYEGETTSNQIKTGFHAGVVADMGLGSHFSVAPALRYSMKGGQEQRHFNTTINGNSATVEQKNKLSYHYLELPVNLVYKTGVEGSGRFMIGAGPYIAYMVNAQNKQKSTSYVIVSGETQEIEDDRNLSLEIGDDQGDHIKGLDYGAQAFIGYQLPMGVFAKAGSQVGFANTQRQQSPLGSYPNQELKQKNYNFFFTLGYMFGGRSAQ